MARSLDDQLHLAHHGCKIIDHDHPKLSAWIESCTAQLNQVFDEGLADPCRYIAKNPVIVALHLIKTQASVGNHICK